MAGASSVHQDILRKHPEADLAVYAVWERSLPTDRRSEWPSEVLDDDRVVQFWDEQQATSRSLPPFADMKSLYHADAYALFGPDSRWDDGQDPTGLISAAPNILGRSGELRADLEPLL